MAEQTLKEGNVLYDAQDLVVLRRAGEDNYVFAARSSLDFQKQTYQESISNPEEANLPAFNHHWKSDDQVGTRGSSTYLTLRYDARTLRPKGLWIPGVVEAKVLEGAGKLENGVYRDCDLAIYSDGNPNQEVAKAITSQAKQLGLSLPLINPFKALDYDLNPEASSGINLKFVQSPQGIISGEEAVSLLASLDYRGNSGAQRLGRGRYGGWYADWDYLDVSNENGRVDWVCGEATAQILMEAYSALNGRRYESRISKLREEEQRLRAEQEADISSFEALLKQ